MDVIRKAPELVVNERMLQGQRVKNTKAKKEVPGWSTEEMVERPSVAVEEDTEEMKSWRCLNQSEMDLCWKKLAERMEEEVMETSTRSKRTREEPLKVEVTPWNGEEYAETRDLKLQSGEKIAGREFSPCSENTICSVCKASRRS